MNIDHELTRVKSKLLLNHPFFASLALNMIYIKDETIPTACTNGKYIKWNPHFFESLAVDERVGLIAHEVMHPVMLHHLRRNGRDPEKWNQACDYVINKIIQDAGIILPKGALLDAKYNGMSADEVYKLLPDNPGGKKWAPGDSFDGGLGDVEDFEGSNEAQEEQEQKARLMEAYTIAKRQGSLTNALNVFVTQILEPKVDWKILLDQLMSEKARDDYSYSKPNRAYMIQGLYAPTLSNFKYDEIVVIADTSMSMWSEEIMNDVATNINDIHQLLQNTIHLIHSDAKVKKVEEFGAFDEFKLELVGGGGTDFIPAFEYIDEHDLQPKLVLYFTDGECRSFPPEPDYPVIWCIKGRDFNPPFGDVIYIN